MSGDFHRCDLEFEQFISKIFGNTVLNDSFPSFLGQVVRHLDVDMMGRDWFFPRPTFLDYFDDFLRDVDAPLVSPTSLKPSGKFFACVVFEDIDVEFALFGETREGEVATSQETDRRIDWVCAVAEVELGMKGMPEEQLDHDLTVPDLVRESAQPRFI